VSYVKLQPILLRIWDTAAGEKGQAMFEVALIISLVALVSLLILTALGVTIIDLFNPLADVING
jgi:Flp pilus assembly pilin Flp